jgi:MarR family transcriptional regulator, organic hydroperoxide resistance regulator
MENRTDSAATDRTLTDGVGFLLARASGLFARAGNAALVPFGLRVRSYSVFLLACESPEGLSQRDLAGVLGLDPSQVVLLVDDLAAAGLVERRPSPSDRRTKLVAATEAGRALRADAVAAVAAAEDEQLAALSAAERRTLRDLLLRVVGDAVDPGTHLWTTRTR